MNTSMLEQLQVVAVQALSADPLFDGTESANGAGVPIVLELKGDIETQIETAIGSVGICALVVTPLFEFHNQLIPSLSGWGLLEVSVLENVPVNQGNGGTKIRAIQLAQRVLCVLHHLPTGLPTDPGDEDPSKFIGLTKPFALSNTGPLLQYTISFQAHIKLTG
jgi:hypothetical protein